MARDRFASASGSALLGPLDDFGPLRFGHRRPAGDLAARAAASDANVMLIELANLYARTVDHRLCIKWRGGRFPPRYRPERRARQNRQTVLRANLSLFIQID
jgi:hypothetical protein